MLGRKASSTGTLHIPDPYDLSDIAEDTWNRFYGLNNVIEKHWNALDAEVERERRRKHLSHLKSISEAYKDCELAQLTKRVKWETEKEELERTIAACARPYQVSP